MGPGGLAEPIGPPPIRADAGDLGLGQYDDRIHGGGASRNTKIGPEAKPRRHLRRAASKVYDEGVARLTADLGDVAHQAIEGSSRQIHGRAAGGSSGSALTKGCCEHQR